MARRAIPVKPEIRRAMPVKIEIRKAIPVQPTERKASKRIVRYFFSSQATLLGFLDDPVEASRRFWIL
jgi:YHS domain-containing protein